MAGTTISLTAYAPNFRDEALVVDALRSGLLINGPMTGALESELATQCGRTFAVSTSSAATGLRGLIGAMGLRRGDDCLMSPFAAPALATALVDAGVRPVLVDIDPSCLNIDPAAMSRALTPQTRAVIFTHCFGNTRNVAQVAAEADQRGLLMIEDASDAVGAMAGGRPAGGFGQASIVSFNAEGPLHAGGGGAVLTDDVQLSDRLASIREKRPGADAHPAGWTVPALGELRAALVLAQLRRLGPARDGMTALADGYMRHLVNVRDLILPTIPEDSDPMWASMICRLEASYDAEARDRVVEYLRSHDVEAIAPRRCLHGEAGLAGVFEAGVRLPLAESVCSRLVRLPFHEGIRQAEASIVAQTLAVAISRENLMRG